MKIYSALYPSDAHLYTQLEQADEFIKVYTPDQLLTKDGILILHGGEDISPSLYGEKANKYTNANNHLSNRDVTELALYKRAVEMGIPIFGICRGAQFLCAMAGGKLVQHVDGHNSGDHRITTVDGEKYLTTSAHHQMMYPFKIKHELIAWSTYSHSHRYVGENEDMVEYVPVEPEIVYFPETKALGVQGHPEWMKPQSDFVSYILSLVKEKLCMV